MRIQFSPCGVGLGHVGRCVPIARRLEKDGADVLFTTYSEGLQFVQQEGFPVVGAQFMYFARIFLLVPDNQTSNRNSS